MIQLHISTASTPSARAAPGSLDATHIIVTTKKSRGTIYSTYLYYSKEVNIGYYTGGILVPRWFYLRMSKNSLLVLVQAFSDIKQSPSYLAMYQRNAWYRFTNIMVLWNILYRSYFYSSIWINYIYLSETSASAHPTRPAWRPLSQRSIHLLILARISVVQRTTRILVTMV